MIVYPRGRRIDMEWGEIPSDLALTSEETIENSSLARQIKLLEKCNKAFKCPCRINGFLSTPIQAHSQNTPLDLAESSVSGFQTTMRLLKRARRLSC